MKKKYKPKVGDIVAPKEAFLGDVYQIAEIKGYTVFLKEITNFDIYTRAYYGYYQFSLCTIINSFKKIN